jgi:hypothetical protein
LHHQPLKVLLSPAVAVVVVVVHIMLMVVVVVLAGYSIVHPNL